jgi:ubiquinone/menaquinone biosynthesis C-methylase UbiE
MKKTIYKAEQGYDLISENYDSGKWSKFWEINEAPFVKKWLKKMTKGFGLDAGAGTGKYLNEIVHSSHDCVQLDISSRMILVNKRKHSEILPNRAIHLKARIDKKIFIDNLFDWVLCTRVLSHCKNLEKQILFFSSYLKPGAECFISDIHPEHSYYQTGFRNESNRKIYIETYKHTILDYKYAIQKAGFEILFLKEFLFNDLIKKPDSINFKKLYNNIEKKIFFILILRKL